MDRYEWQVGGLTFQATSDPGADPYDYTEAAAREILRLAEREKDLELQASLQRQQLAYYEVELAQAGLPARPEKIGWLAGRVKKLEVERDRARRLYDGLVARAQAAEDRAGELDGLLVGAVPYLGRIVDPGYEAFTQKIRRALSQKPVSAPVPGPIGAGEGGEAGEGGGGAPGGGEGDSPGPLLAVYECGFCGVTFEEPVPAGVESPLTLDKVREHDCEDGGRLGLAWLVGFYEYRPPAQAAAGEGDSRASVRAWFENLNRDGGVDRLFESASQAAEFRKKAAAALYAGEDWRTPPTPGEVAEAVAGYPATETFVEEALRRRRDAETLEARLLARIDREAQATAEEYGRLTGHVTGLEVHVKQLDARLSEIERLVGPGSGHATHHANLGIRLQLLETRLARLETRPGSQPLAMDLPLAGEIRPAGDGELREKQGAGS